MPRASEKARHRNCEHGERGVQCSQGGHGGDGEAGRTSQKEWSLSSVSGSESVCNRLRGTFWNVPWRGAATCSRAGNYSCGWGRKVSGGAWWDSSVDSSWGGLQGAFEALRIKDLGYILHTVGSTEGF